MTDETIRPSASFDIQLREQLKKIYHAKYGDPYGDNFSEDERNLMYEWHTSLRSCTLKPFKYPQIPFVGPDYIHVMDAENKDREDTDRRTRAYSGTRLIFPSPIQHVEYVLREIPTESQPIPIHEWNEPDFVQFILNILSGTEDMISPHWEAARPALQLVFQHFDNPHYQISRARKVDELRHLISEMLGVSEEKRVDVDDIVNRFSPKKASVEKDVGLLVKTSQDNATDIILTSQQVINPHGRPRYAVTISYPYGNKPPKTVITPIEEVIEEVRL